ncbi:MULTISPECIES: hypothetical protein [Pseudomonas]|uniref:Uncharacterized protein n=2 Tax=Pseudomonas TaxID=286 RepID=A0ABM7CTR0_9PSED|nr:MULTISPECIES: hypothetical protein [Pseudomonas]AZL69731.1 hypothetical protein EJA05_19285 [Pseudomonas oryziphila]AZL74853.1 hypothetical protein EI693_17940 [Pseudomonas oryziphila]UVL87787.1 hypothetical protein LOY51_18640 [Pseudomonas sichuanensis]
MNSRRLALVGSVDLQPTLEKVQKDDVLEFAEYSMLRESADAKLYQLMNKVRAGQGLAPATLFDGEEDLRRLQEASMRMAHLLQTSCLALRRLGLEQQDKHLAREALEYQLAYMQACLRRSMASFGEF